MTEQRYETGPSAGPPPDDATREMRAVDVLREHADDGASEAPAAAAEPASASSTSADEAPAGATGPVDDPEGSGEAPVPEESARPLAGASRSRTAADGDEQTTALSAAPPAVEPAAPEAAARRRPRTAAAPARSRRARLHLRRVDPFSVFLLALLLSLFLAIVIVVAVVALYGVLAAAGVPDTINELFAEITRASGTGTVEPEPLLTARRAVLAAGVIAAVDVVLLTVLATLGALLYNLCASFTGGLTVTLAEPEDR